MARSMANRLQTENMGHLETTHFFSVTEVTVEAIQSCALVFEWQNQQHIG
jgi:hypothetical protein